MPPCFKLWGFPKIRDAFFGAPILGIIVFEGLYRDSPDFGKLPHLVVIAETLEGACALSNELLAAAYVAIARTTLGNLGNGVSR